MPYRLAEFEGRTALTNALADAILTDLRADIAKRGAATLVVPGGTTPVAVFERLAATPFDWDKVTIIPCDERWVPTDHSDSNERLVRAHLLQGAARSARLFSLYRPLPDPAEALPEVSAALAAIPRPFSAIFLGMGEDGHFASLFPGRTETSAALDPSGTASLMIQNEPAKGHRRIGLTLSALLDCRRVLLAVTGAEKRATLDRAITNITSDALPVAALLRQARCPVELFIAA